MNKKTFKLFFILSLFFCMSVFLFHFHKKKNAHRELEKVSDIVAESLWNFDRKSSEQYLKETVKRNNYQKLVIKNTDGEILTTIDQARDKIIERILLKMNLIPHTPMAHPIYYKEMPIGTLEVTWVNTALYTEFILFVLFVLILVIIHLYQRVLTANRNLEDKVEERTVALVRKGEKLTEQLKMQALGADIGTILSRGGAMAVTLQQCCESLVRHIDAAFARIWLVNADEQVLELKASAGLYTHLNGEQSRISIGDNMIGSIAENKKPLFTNSLMGNPLIHDQVWAKRENMVSFAGQPLMVAEKIVGVMAFFACHPLTEAVGKSLASVADGIAMGVERKRYEEELAFSQTRLKTLVRTIPDLVWLKDTNGVYLACNSRFEKFFGAKESEIVGKTDYDFLSKESAEFFREKDQAAILAGQPSLNEEEVTFADDGHREFLETIKTPMSDDEGKIVGVLGIARDITDRKKAAEVKETLEKQLLQAQKMESIGTLAGGIAHDFNNILSAIYGYAELAFDDITKPDILRRDLHEILKGAERAKNLVHQILTFSRKNEEKKEPLQISLVIKETLKLLRSSIPSTIDMKQDISSEALVLADPTQIHQVIMNLCTNAYHAMRETGGTLGVTLKDIDISEAGEIPELKHRPGKYIQLEISDTGTGMDDEIKSKIFEPYFTTKGLGEGTGLGLAVVHGVVVGNGGRINVHSGPGQGTTFHIYFPVYEGEHDGISPEEEAAPLAGGNETIMFVDDDINIIELAKRILMEYGYAVYAFTNAVQAYQELQQHPDKYDLIITDMTMPYMTGADLARKALEIRPALPVILCSGHSELINPEKALAMGIREYCAKPLKKMIMLRTVRNVLDNALDYKNNDREEHAK